MVEYNKNPYDLEPAITAKELYKKWTEEYFKTLKNDSSARAVDSAWAYCSSVYDMRVMDIRARHVKGCMDEGVAIVKGKEQKPSASMKNKIKSLFNLMLDYALEYEIVKQNYARTFTLTDETIKEIQTVKKEHIPFSDDEMKLLWEHVDDKYCVDVLLIQCYSGWRPQELGLIELSNVDLSKWIFTGGMKTEAGEDRTVPIHPRIQSLVERKYREAEKLGSKYLFNYVDPDSRQKNIKLTYNRYQRVFSRIRDELNLNPEHRPHDGRKHFVTMAKNMTWMSTPSNIWWDIRSRILRKRSIRLENLIGCEKRLKNKIACRPDEPHKSPKRCRSAHSQRSPQQRKEPKKRHL